MTARSIVNVCFHGLGEPRRELEPGEDVYWVSVERFHQILDEVATWPAVRISFDDGNVSDTEIGLPALRQRGLTADFFVVAGRLGEPGSLREEDVRRLSRAGMGVGTHGMRHRSWRRLGTPERHEELVDARDRLAEVVGRPVDTAAIPMGQYDRQVLGALRQYGYQKVFTSDRRAAGRDAWLQPRYSVRREDTPESLRSEAFGPTPLGRRMRSAAVGVVKQWR